MFSLPIRFCVSRVEPFESAVGLSRYPPLGISFFNKKQKERSQERFYIALFLLAEKRRKICK
nr:MAG TPA: hypothetical protein [Caudoviricetes sp.]